MKNIILLTTVLFCLSFTHSYSQYEFGISKYELINKIGAPDDIRKSNNDTVYEYQTISPSLEFSVKNYFFNEYNELKEVQIIHIYSNCYDAKNKLNKLLSSAKNKYPKSQMMNDNMTMAFVKNGSQEGYTIKIRPQNLGDSSCYAEERYIGLKYS